MLDKLRDEVKKKKKKVQFNSRPKRKITGYIFRLQTSQKKTFNL